MRSWRWLALLGMFCAGAACAQYPNRAVTLVVGYPPGGSNDIAARILAGPLAEVLGASVVVDNRPGANAVIGTDSVAKAAPDGYTLLVASASPVVIAPHTFAKLPYDTLNDFAPISLMAAAPEAIAVNPALPVRNLQELVALAKKQRVTLSSSGNGGMPHLAIELLKTQAGADFLHVPYKGAGPAVTDTLGGHVNGIVMDLPAVIAPIQDGRLRVLAITATRRTEALPDVPTSGEQGLPTVLAENWVGVFAPAKTPKAVVDKLYDAVVKVASRPDVKAQLVKAAMTPTTSESPQAFRAFLASEHARWGKIARDSGARAD